MQISIRTGMLGKCNAVFVYRPYERSQSVAHAFETKSGFWIVSIPFIALDVARDRKDAERMLSEHYSQLDAAK